MLVCLGCMYAYNINSLVGLTHLCVCVCVYIYICVCVCVCVCMCIYIYIHSPFTFFRARVVVRLI